jgi:Flp pilus assembly protein TadG
MKNQKGQAVVETALVIPLLLVFLCMIIDTGRIVYFECRLNSICQESVRMAGIGYGETEIRSYVLNQFGSSYASTLNVSFSPDVPDGTPRKSGDLVTVILSDDINYITPFANAILHSPFKAAAQSTIRVE